MKNKNLTRQPQKSALPYAAILIGAGLMVLGLVAALVIARPKQQSSPSGDTGVSDDYPSVIPSPVNFAAPELSLNHLSGETASLSSYSFISCENSRGTDCHSKPRKENSRNRW